MNIKKEAEQQELLNLVTKLWGELGALFSPLDLKLIRNYLDVVIGSRQAPPNTLTRSFFPRLYFPGLASMPFCQLEGLAETIGSSLVDKIYMECQHALGASERVDHSDLLGQGQWHCSYLVREFELLPRACSRYSVTHSFLKNSRVASEALFSRLADSSLIPAHSDNANYLLTVHIPLHATDATITVCNETRKYVRGVPICFDSTFVHSVANGERNRDVLLFNIWHPSLTDAEVAALNYIRQQWVLSYCFDPYSSDGSATGNSADV
jgi:hypothetical protein